MGTQKNGTPFDDVYAATDRILAHTWPNKGGTFNARTGESVGDIEGYAVNAGIFDTLKIKLDSPRLRDQVARYIQAVPIVGDFKPYVGTWIEDDILYVDLVRIYTNQYAAMLQGAKLNEIAIFDLGRGTTIYL